MSGSPNPVRRAYLPYCVRSSVINSKGITSLFRKVTGGKVEDAMADEAPAQSEDDLVGLSQSETEYSNARRVLRQAGWATVFFLITCACPFQLRWWVRAEHRPPPQVIFSAHSTLHTRSCRSELSLECFSTSSLARPPRSVERCSAGCSFASTRSATQSRLMVISLAGSSAVGHAICARFFNPCSLFSTSGSL